MKIRIFVWLMGLALAVITTPRIAAQERGGDSLSPVFPSGDKLSPPLDKKPGTYVSSWLAEVEKLARAGVEDGVMLAFIDSAGTFNLGADQIIELRDLGVSKEVITAIIEHDSELVSGMRPMPSIVSASEPSLGISLRNVPSSSYAVSDFSPPMKESSGSIVQELAPAESFENFAQPVVDEQKPVVRNREGTSPVREPYPVKLTDPIIVFKASVRPPNLVIIAPFP